MRLQLPLSERARRLHRWLIPAALLALAPKCVLCVLAYASVGAALGLGGPELCGAPADAAGHWTLLLPALGAGLGVSCLAAAVSRRRAVLRRHRA